ncbi:MAG: response regulator transcription factor [Kiloniellales bacterium]|nr:response regulator transcription factor [Kiloniellales bacterium]
MKILIVDDHWVFRAGLKHLVESLGPDVLVLEADTFEEAFRLASQNKDLDLVVLDLLMPDSDPFTGLRELREAFPTVPVVVLSVLEQRRDVIRAIELGAMGYIPKAATGEEIIKALQHVLAGDIFVPRALLDTKAKRAPNAEVSPATQADNRRLVETLTQRQREVFELLAQGKSNPEIARELGVSAHTVRIHISAILRALGVSNRTQAAVLAAGHAVQDPSSLAEVADEGMR